MARLTDELAYWINERYAVKLRKQRGDNPPWSKDPVFQTVRFCNVHREDDKVTKWMREYWNRGNDPAWRFVLGRMINLPESLAPLVLMSDLPTMKERLKDLRYAGGKIFTSAYTISTCGRKMDKLDYVFDHVVQAVCEAGEPEYPSLAACAENLGNIDGLGTFLAGQVVADMKNTVGHPLAKAPDWWTWSAPGPGSLRGLSWYFRQQPTGISAKDYSAALKVCRNYVDPLIHEDVPRISDQDFQNCLCEFSKWCNVKFLNGHVRNKYVA